MIICSSVTRSKDKMEDAMAAIAAAGFKDIDLIAINKWAHFDPADLAADFAAITKRAENALKANGLTMRAMNVGMNGQMHDRKKETVESNLKELDALCRFMKHFGAKNCALQPLQKDPGRDAADVLKDSVDSLEEYYECTLKHGISLGLELHVHSPFESVEAARYVYERIPEATVVFDPTHFISMGGSLKDCEYVMDKAVHVHIRDAAEDMIQTKVGEGSVDFEWVVTKLLARGYKGHFSIEYLCNEEWDALAEAVKLRGILEKWIS
ncbi:MAG: sugar phosphate isomerase/epimerase [Defluviitaleaceae bacterium]|nr:sugar phosphate isomerase/epimerase [Defluviitaleaceae bacterium]